MRKKKQSIDERSYVKATQKEINALADAILRGIAWRQRMMQLKQEARIARMIKKQLRLRQNREFSLTD